MPKEPPHPKDDLLKDWFHRARVSQFAHYDETNRLNRLHRSLGTATAVLAAISGTSVFATLNDQPHLYWKLLVGLIIVLAAVLAALQTFLNYSERAEKHRVAGARFGSIRREIEVL